MFIPLAPGRTQQDSPRATCRPRLTRLCHNACAPAAADAFVQAGILAPGETGGSAAAFAVRLDRTRTDGGRYVRRDLRNTDTGRSWCLICAREIGADDRVAIISIAACP